MCRSAAASVCCEQANLILSRMWQVTIFPQVATSLHQRAPMPVSLHPCPAKFQNMKLSGCSVHHSFRTQECGSATWTGGSSHTGSGPVYSASEVSASSSSFNSSAPRALQAPEPLELQQPLRRKTQLPPLLSQSRADPP